MLFEKRDKVDVGNLVGNWGKNMEKRLKNSVGTIAVVKGKHEYFDYEVEWEGEYNGYVPMFKEELKSTNAIKKILENDYII